MYVNGVGNLHGRIDLWEIHVGISIITSNILGDMNIIMNIRGGKLYFKSMALSSL